MFESVTTTLDDGSSFTVTHDGTDDGGRQVYAWTIETGGIVITSATDGAIHSGVGADVDLAEAVRSFCSFATNYPNGENVDLFPAEVHEWLTDHSDELSAIGEEPSWDPNTWDLLEQDAPAGCDAVQDLYSWSLNYDAGKGPFTLFLDLIGWSEDELGETLFSLASASLGYLELSKLAAALTEYADAPHDVRAYVDVLMAAESR